jgi:hypothetical protein
MCADRASGLRTRSLEVVAAAVGGPVHRYVFERETPRTVAHPMDETEHLFDETGSKYVDSRRATCARPCTSPPDGRRRYAT